jgi:membrane-associated phospholipid phosphatase
VPQLSGNKAMKKRWIVVYVFGACFILTIASYLFWDIPLTKYCHNLSRSVLNAAEIITAFGVASWYIVASALFFLIFKFIYKNKLYSSQFLFMFSSLSVCGLILILIKWIAGRHRPIDLFNNGFFGFDYFAVGYDLTSFPSGHAQTAFTLATVITILFPRWGIPVFIAASLIGISRIVLTSHYLSDVFAGAGIGILFTLAVKYVFDKYNLDLAGQKKVT